MFQGQLGLDGIARIGACASSEEVQGPQSWKD